MSEKKYNLSDTPKVRDDLLFKELDDGGVVYIPSTEECHSLNATSAYIWALCDGNHSINIIIDSIKEDFHAFDISPEDAVLSFLNDLDKKNLLERK